MTIRDVIVKIELTQLVIRVVGKVLVLLQFIQNVFSTRLIDGVIVAARLTVQVVQVGDELGLSTVAVVALVFSIGVVVIGLLQ